MLKSILVVAFATATLAGAVNAATLCGAIEITAINAQGLTAE
jgi:hypothetical protein